MPDADIVNMRYLVDDVAACIDYYTRHFGFTVGISSPAFADLTRDAPAPLGSDFGMRFDE